MKLRFDAGISCLFTYNFYVLLVLLGLFILHIGDWQIKVQRGDAMRNPVLESTRAISIESPADKIWPWLVQMGQGRGGLYSYERLENLAGTEPLILNTLL
jgi:hypothetical protein